LLRLIGYILIYLYITGNGAAKPDVDKGPVTGGTKDPKKPACPGNGGRYGNCVNPPKSKPCETYKRNCPPA